MSQSPRDTYFITGGSGYIGRNLIRALITEGHRVKALARSSASAKYIESLGAEAILGDLLSPEALRIGMEEASHLIHAAADTDHAHTSKTQKQTNLDGTHNVYTAAKTAGIKRAVHLSTEAVLLKGAPLKNANEQTPIPDNAQGSYSKTKAAAENIALNHSTSDCEIIIIRPRLVWGRDDTTALPQFIEAAKVGKLAWIGGGQYKTSTTHIANLVHGISLAFTHGRGGEIYFISDGEPVIFRSFISSLLATQGATIPTREVPRWLVASLVRIGTALGNLSGGAITGPMSWQEYATFGAEVTININKARRELNYTPVISIEEGLAELAAQHAKEIPKHT